MSPILVRPVREQLEHDRVIRLLQQDLQKRKVEVGINPGFEQNAGVGAGSRKEYPDAVIYSLEKGKKVVGVLEVETGESVNHLEAMAQWAHLAKLRVPFHLYVPTGSVDVARRLSTDYNIQVTEIWAYHQVGEQFRFTLIHPAATGRGRGAATAPRTVSVSTIRVPLPDPDALARAAEPAEDPAARGQTPVRPGPAASTRAPAAPRVVPAKVPAKVPPARVAAARTVPAKTAGRTPVAAAVSRAVVRKSEPAKATTARPLAARPSKPAPKPALKPAARAGAKSSGQPSARESAKPRTLPPRAARSKTPAKPARAVRAAKTARKPAGRRK